MSTVTILILVLIAVVLSIVIGSIFNINMGILALIFAAIIGGIFLDIMPRTLYTYWPSSVIIQIIGVTFFYGFVGETGAIAALSNHIIYRVQNRFWMMPVIIYLLAAALGYIGVNPMGINALILPVVAGLCMHTNRSPFALFMIYGAGNLAGILSPLGSAGIVASGMISSIVGDAASGMMPRIYVNNFIFSLIVFALWYVLFRCWGMKVDSEHKDIFKEKPASFNKEQKRVLMIMFAAIAFFIIVGVFRIPIINSMIDVGWVYMLCGAICLVLKLGNGRTIIFKSIPWSIILLVGGFSILLGLMTNNGVADMIAAVLSDSVPTSVITPLMSLMAGITSMFSDSIGVVLPLYIPICAGLISSGISATGIFSAAVIGALSTGAAPISTGGAMVMSFAPDELKKKMFWILLLSAAINLVIIVLLSASGIFG